MERIIQNSKRARFFVISITQNGRTKWQKRPRGRQLPRVCANLSAPSMPDRVDKSPIHSTFLLIFQMRPEAPHHAQTSGAYAQKGEAGASGGVIDKSASVSPPASSKIYGSNGKAIRVDKSVNLYPIRYAESIQLKGDYRDHSNRNRTGIFLPRT